MNEDITQHVLDEIEAYLTDGLSPPERQTFETHVAGCPACAATLARAKAADAELRRLFKDAHPPVGFEDNMIQKLRAAGNPRRLFIGPMALRSAAAIAAAVLLAGTGVAVSNVLDGQTGFAALLPSSSHANHSIAKQAGLSSDRDFDDLADTSQTLASVDRGDTLGRARRGFVARNPMGYGMEQKQEKLPEAHGFGRSGPIDAYATLSRDGAIERKSLAGNERGAVPGAGLTTLNYEVEKPSGGAAKSGDNSYAFRPADQLGIAAWGENRGEPGFGAAGAGGGGGFGGGGLVGKPVLVAGVSAGDAVKPGTPGAVTWQLQTGLVPTAAAATPPATEGQLAQAAGEPAAPATPPGLLVVAAPDVAPPGTSAPANPPASVGRKVIRNGTMEFEVEGFDDALIRVTKLVVEQGGFIATTDSDKLPNGKMRGTVTLRVPPEHLDTLALTLRGIGDLKSQKITAEDVTKHYTDLESQLRASQAMYDRLIDIVKNAKGQIKDLVAAEKELGVWEEKIEQIKGEQRYLDNLIGFSTLTLVLYEKDIKTPASVSETEQVSMSLETEKVDDDYNKAIDAIKQAKGRIVQSELKQYDAGQLGGTIQAAIPPDAAEAVIARLRQLDGRIAHFSRDRNQKMQSGEVASAAVPRVTREDMILSMQIYNLANIAPRRTTTIQLAAGAVEKSYQQVIDQVRSAGGRIVTSSLVKPDANTQVADLDFQVPAEKADLLLETLRGYGEVMRQDAAENPDTANVTEAKRGVHLRIVSLAAVAARETQTLQLAAASVPQAFADILTAVKGVDGRVFQSDLNEQNSQDVSGALVFEIPRSAAAAVNATIGKATQTLGRAVARSADVENTVDTKVRMSLTLSSGDHLPPRQVTTVREEVSDVERAVDDLVNAANAAGGRRIGAGDISQDRAGRVTAQVIVDVPLAQAGPILDGLEKAGYRRSKQVAFDGTMPDGPLSRARIDATFSNSSASLGGEETTWDAIRHGLATSGHGLRLSLQMLIIGVCFVAPWVLALWILVRLIRRSRVKTTGPAVAPA